MGVPDALLTSCDKTFQRGTYHPPFSLVCVAFKKILARTLCRVYNSGLELVAWLWWLKMFLAAAAVLTVTAVMFPSLI